MVRCFRLVLLLVLLGGIEVGIGDAPTATAGTGLQVLKVVGGQPDDIVTDPQGRLVWGDLARGTISRLDHGRVVMIAAGLSVPEGIVALGRGRFIVAEQGPDRIVQVDNQGRRTVLYQLQAVPGREGVDGIARDARTGTLLIPDAPRGTVLRLNLRTHGVRTLAQGLGRPVDAAVDTNGNILVPDEHLGTLVVITPRGHVSYRGTLATPDDVVVDHSDRIWVTTLGDGGLWVIAPHAPPRRVLAGLANPQGLTLDRCGDPIIVEQNAVRIVRLLLGATSAHCSL